VLPYDPIPWLMAQESLPAVRARRLLGLRRQGDEEAAHALQIEFARDQLADGSFEQSPMKTAGVLNLLDDLKVPASERLIAPAVSYLISVLEPQPAYERVRDLTPGSLRKPCDLCGFFGPYEDRNRPEVLARGAREMNFYREYEPLLGPRSSVRRMRRSSLDRVGPSSCYAWGLVPLCYTIEALSRAGHAHDERLRPAINVLLGAQRRSGGWCRNLAGHPDCSVHAIRALGSHPDLRRSAHADKALKFMHSTQRVSTGHLARWWRGSKIFAAIQAIAAFDLPIAREIIGDALTTLAARQQKNGTFGGPHRIERVAAVLVAAKAIDSVKE